MNSLVGYWLSTAGGFALVLMGLVILISASDSFTPDQHRALTLLLGSGSSLTGAALFFLGSRFFARSKPD
jgi:hypothetical protein